MAVTAKASANGGLVALGDSITFGYNLTPGNLTPSQKAFPYLVGGADHLPVTDLGIPGWTSSDLMQAVQTPNFARAIQNARVISVDIGNNDLLHLAGRLGLLQQAGSSTPITITPAEQQQFAQTIQQLAKNLAQIFAIIKQETNAPVVVYNEYDPFPASSVLHGPAEAFIHSANAAIAQVAGHANVPVLNAYSAFDGKQLQLVRVAETDVHPTPAGQQVLAVLLENELKKLTLPSGAAAGSPQAITTALASNTLSPSGNTWTAPLGSGDITLTASANAIPFSDYVAVTSVDPTAVQYLAPTGDHVVAEFGITFADHDSPTRAVAVRYTNGTIPPNAALYEIGARDKLVQIPDVTVNKGLVSASVIGDGDFVVVAPNAVAPSKKPTQVPGATSPQTGFPWLTDGVAGALLLVFGAFVIRKSGSRKQ